MLCIALLSCLAKTPSTIQPEPLFELEQSVEHHVEILEVIDLTHEFDLEQSGWVFVMEKHTIPPDSTLNVPPNAGWFMISGTLDEHIDTVGLTTVNMSISNLSGIGQDVLVASVRKRTTKTPIPTLPAQTTIKQMTKTAGLTMLGTSSIDLDSVPFQKKLRYRHVSLNDSGVVGLHTHDQRPSVAVILEGALIEHRGDGDQERVALASVAERDGLTHWWETTTDSARIIVFDLVDD